MTGEGTTKENVVGIITARVAVLVDHYHLSLPEIGNLTDKQIVKVYFHARDEDGTIRLPVPTIEKIDKPETLESVLADLEFLRMFLPHTTQENYEKSAEEIRRKFDGSQGQ